MKPIRLVPDGTKIDFVRMRWPAFGLTTLLLLVTIVSLVVQGLSLGIDFKGGILIEAKAAQPVDVAPLREKLGALGLGEVQIQQFGGPRDILVRIQRQEGGEAAQNEAVQKVRATLGADYEYRRVEVVGPAVGAELFRDGMIATVLAVLAIAAYVAVRFEWQFGVSALIATMHDVVCTMGLFSVLQLEFNLTAVAALLTLAGYSINDTVVVFDRIREVLRKQKAVDMPAVINMAVNDTLSRTILTGGTTLAACLPMLIWGGDVLRNFTAAITFGILIGTFSSVFVAASLLLYMKPVRAAIANAETAKVPAPPAAPISGQGE